MDLGFIVEIVLFGEHLGSYFVGKQTGGRGVRPA